MENMAASRSVNYWSFSAIIMAFIDLAIAYTLLCGSAFAFIASQFLSFLGINLPCFCSGVFGYQNDGLCWHKLLIDWPIRNIIVVEELIKNRFPYDSAMFDHNVEGYGNRKFANRVTELEEEACSTSLSGPTAYESVDRESGCEAAKGKKIMNQKSKSGIRRRRRAALGYGKVLPAMSSNSSDSVGVGGVVLHPFYDASGMKSRYGESMDADQSGKEDGFPGNPGDRQASAAGNDANVIQMLERALEEEKGARAVLYQELEKERSAAASAADEAMAMISRLQEDKASIEMEARQYHREIEEKFHYEEEEMKILKEILLRREKEILILEKEVEAYEEMNCSSGNEQEEGDLSYKVKTKEWRPSHSVDSKGNSLLMPLQIDNTKESPQGFMRKRSRTEGKAKIEKGISIISPETYSSGEELQKDGEDWNQEGCNMCSSMLDSETVFDVHVIDDKTVLSKADHKKETGTFSTAEFSSDCPNMGMEEIDSQLRSSTAVDGERLRIDNEVEWLRERLRVVQEEKEKLAFSAEHSERVNSEMKLVDGIVSQLREVHVKNPLRQASLIASSSNF